jgi:hypothetical protein
MLCGFLEADGCSAMGTCVTDTGARCNAIVLACACDGTDFNVICGGYPDGYASKPLAHMGVCTVRFDAGLEAGAYCSTDSDCAGGLKCCYPCGIPGCHNECIKPLPSGLCPAFP